MPVVCPSLSRLNLLPSAGPVREMNSDLTYPTSTREWTSGWLGRWHIWTLELHRAFNCERFYGYARHKFILTLRLTL